MNCEFCHKELKATYLQFHNYYHCTYCRTEWLCSFNNEIKNKNIKIDINGIKYDIGIDYIDNQTTISAFINDKDERQTVKIAETIKIDNLSNLDKKIKLYLTFA